MNAIRYSHGFKMQCVREVEAGKSCPFAVSGLPPRDFFGSSLPQRKSWHRDLLDCMAAAETARPAVISTGLHDRLDDYLTFRHRFRNLYGFELEWERMADLVSGCACTLEQLEAELDAFLAATQWPIKPAWMHLVVAKGLPPP